jgi:predicted metal-dependent RNase
MSQVNYAEMSDRELKQYFLQNREDRDALEAYLDRIKQRPQQIIASPGDPDFNEKIQAAIRQKLQALESTQLKD